MWYVYRHIRLDLNEPFYIGIGCKKEFKRAYDFKNRSNFWLKINNKTTIEVEILFENLTKKQASDKEKEFVALYGRKDNGTGILCNMTDGGDGILNCIRSEKTKELLRNQKLGYKNPQFGKKQSLETRNKRIKSLTGKTRSNAVKEKQSLSSVKSGQANLTEVFDYKTKISLGVFHSMSEACRSVGLNPSLDSGKASLVARGLRKHCKNYIFKYL
jgi:hypothetical protein